jgi:hypothetical protein
MRRACAVLGLVFILVPTPASGAERWSWPQLHRVLHLPSAAGGVPCPAPSSGITLAGGQVLNGSGPAYLLGVGNAPAGVISIVGSQPDGAGWRGQKTPWLLAFRYKGPLLVRGARIDAPGAMSFAKGYGQHLAELRFRAGENNGADRSYRFLASSTLFRAAGCYAFQLDGTTFSSVVVMNVTDAR